MLNQELLQDALKQYRESYFLKHWNDEKYKWEAVQWFQDHWDIEAVDFPKMLSESLSKTYNLLDSQHHFPRKMIISFAEKRQEEVRDLFRQLFNENNELFDRITTFQECAKEMLRLYGDGAKNHYQDLNSITAYLWLYFPNTYYLYKYSIVRKVSKKLEGNYTFTKGLQALNVENFVSMYNELNEAIKQDEALLSLVKPYLVTPYYSDSELKTLTMDVGFYIANFYGENEEYNPEISEEQWENLVQDENVFTPGALAIMKRLKDIGGEASCTQLAEKYGEPFNFYKAGSVALAKRICQAAEIEPDQSEGNTLQWWPVLYTGRTATTEETGSFIWRLRDELSKALDTIDMSQIPLYVNGKIEGQTHLPLVYTEGDFLKEVYLSQEDYHHLTGLLTRKKNLILQGPPGVGKTFAARRLAYALLGKKETSHVEQVQFHQNYSYEDFVMGYKPSGEGFALQNGVFYNFCQKAAQTHNEPFFFIIDEINRGNLSKIFGELLMLIESDYRGKEHEILLAYNQKPFYVPENLYIIGMMNTADRSLALMDYALRRRFSFFDIKPGFEADGFKKYQESLHSEKFNALVEKLTDLNEEIEKDPSLGKGFCIGHSYLCGLTAENLEETLRAIVNYDILPQLQEYWFDNEEKYSKWFEKLTEVL